MCQASPVPELGGSQVDRTVAAVPEANQLHFNLTQINLSLVLLALEKTHHEVLQIMKRFFIRVLFITAIIAIVSIADSRAAQSRPDTNRMTCGAAKALVMKHGGIVLAPAPQSTIAMSSRAPIACLRK